MKPLDELLDTFTPRNIMDFKKWIRAHRNSTQDIKLLVCLKKYGAQGSDVVARNFLKKNATMHAYYSARRRLHAKMVEFLITTESADDPSHASVIVGHLLIVMRCIRRKKLVATFYHLQQAEEMARTAQHLGLLDQILYLYVKYAEVLGVSIKEAVNRWEENSKRLHSFRRIEIAFAEIREELNESKKRGKQLNVDAIIHDVFNRFEITKSEANDPEMMMRLIGIGRSAYISVKQYRKLEPFIERIYTRLVRANAFGPGLAACECEYLYLLAHTYYRNGKFAHAHEFVHKLKNKLDDHPSLKQFFEPRMLSLKCNIYAYTGKNDDAILDLQKALRKKTVKDDEQERVNMQLNLAVCYFNEESHGAALKQLNLLPTESKLLALKGKEWLLKKQMIHIIVLYEKGQDTKAMTMLKYVLKMHADVWDQPIFSLSNYFLHFTQRIFMNRNITSDAAFREKFNDVRLSASAQEEDLQAIAFYCWLKSKILGGKYYDILVKRVNKK